MTKWCLRMGLVVLLAAAAAADPGFEASLRPSLNLPIGRDSEVYSAGGGILLDGRFPLPFYPRLELGLGLGYDVAPLQAWDADGRLSVSLLSSRLSLGLRWPLGPRWELHGAAEGGYFYGFLNRDGTGGGNPCLGGNAGATYRMTPLLDLSLLVGYRSFLGLYNDLSVGVGAGLDVGTVWQKRPPPPVKQGSGVELLEVSLDPVFPVFFKYYDSHPLGRVIVVNYEKSVATDVRLSLLVKQYMDNPKQAERIDRLEPGERRTVELYGLFTDRILEVTEGTKVSALLSLSYAQDKKTHQKERVETLDVVNRNAMTWDDDRKASSFVTAKNPTVQKFAKNLSGMIRGSYPTLDANLLSAVALHEALDLYGITYVVDPKTPFQQYSQNKAAIDYLQFPTQTLEFRAGDCDDLSILYAALLEAVGIEAAFITTPGHIYVAFALTFGPEEVDRRLYRKQDVIVRDGRVWLPVEVTERSRGFLRAWEAGAREWREADAKRQAALYQMREGWQLYQPVGFQLESPLSMPDRQQLLDRYRREVDRFVEAEVAPQAASLEADIARRQGEPRVVNQLGVLYARYGLNDRAEAQFQRVLKTREYLPALINLGNLGLLCENWAQALSYYERAQSLDPRNGSALLGSARALRELGREQAAAEVFGRLKSVAPELAQRFAYLGSGGGGRAAEAEADRGVVVWYE